MRLVLSGMAILGSLILSGFAVRSAWITAARLRDPCFQWSAPIRTQVGSQLSPRRLDEDCGTVRASTSETRARAVTRMVGVSGVIVLSTAAGLLGILSRKPGLMLVAGLSALLETIPLLFSLAPIAALTGVAFLALWQRERTNVGLAAP